MLKSKRNALSGRIRPALFPALLLVGGFFVAGCSKDPVEPTPVEPEPTFSVTFADGDFTGAFQVSHRGGYVAAGTAAGGNGFIYKIDPDGTEATHYNFASTNRVRDVLPVDDGGYMVCGYNGVDGWVAKIDGNLQTVENNLYRGSGREDYLSTMAPLADGGFVTGGEYDWDRTWSTGDGWLVKVTSSGVYDNQAVFGGGARDYISAITPAGDGGFFFGGATFPSPTAEGRGWICKTNATANVLEWNKSYIYSLGTSIQGVVATSDGGCLCVGGTLRMETPQFGSSDAYILKVNASGNEAWSKRSGIDGADSYSSVVRAHDGGYVCAGTRYNPIRGWLVKIDDNGNTVWEKTYDGGNINSIRRTSGNGYLCSGQKDNRAWLLRVDIRGDFDQ